MGGKKAGALSVAARRSRPPLAAQGEKGPASRRLRLHFDDGIHGKPVPFPAVRGLDLRRGNGQVGAAEEMGAGGGAERAGQRLSAGRRGRGRRRCGAWRRGDLDVPGGREPDRRRRDREIRRQAGGRGAAHRLLRPCLVHGRRPGRGPGQDGGRTEGPDAERVGAAAHAAVAADEHGLGLGGVRARPRRAHTFLRRPLRLQRHGPAGVRRADRPLLDPLRPGITAGIHLQQRSGRRRMELPGQPVDGLPHLQDHRLRPGPEMPGVRRPRLHLFLRPGNGQMVAERGAQPIPAQLLRDDGLRHAKGRRRLG